MIWFFILFPLSGALLALKFNKKSYDLSTLMLFSGAYLLTVTLAGVLPEAVSQTKSVWLFVGIGYIIQLVLDNFSKGVEHGHIHDTKDMQLTPLFIALWLHAFLEGMPIAMLNSEYHIIFNYLAGLALHEIPAGFILAFILFKKTNRKLLNTFLIILYAAAIPIGYSISSVIKQKSWYKEDFKYIILALCSGILLHIATTVISENFIHHSFNKKKWIAFAAGLGVAIISLLSHQIFNH